MDAKTLNDTDFGKFACALMEIASERNDRGEHVITDDSIELFDRVMSIVRPFVLNRGTCTSPIPNHRNDD